MLAFRGGGHGSVHTVKNNGAKIGPKAGTLRRKIDDQLNTLTDHVQALRRLDQT